jgi:L-lactate dehydrogenase complex protein LldE
VLAHESLELDGRFTVGADGRVFRSPQYGALVELERETECCGFGGTFSVDLPGVSTGMADDKIDELETLGIDAVVSGDASCLMQLEGRLEARGSRIRAVHLAEILAARDVRRSTPLGASS